MRLFFGVLFLYVNVLIAQDLETHFEIYGEGYPVLLINGGPGFSSEGFRPLAKKLSANHQIIIYDQRGTGNSHLEAINSENISLELMVTDIEDLRNRLGVDSWVVMGHSFGGMLASFYTSIHSDRVTSLILSASGGLDLSILGSTLVYDRLTQYETDSLRYWTNRIQGGDNSDLARLKRATFLAPAYLENKDYVSVVAERLTQGNLALNGLVWQDMRNINFDVKEEMKKFTKPVLILHGEQDVVDPSSALAAHDIFPNSTLVIMPNCSHYGWLDRPDIYYPKVFDFLKQFS